MARLKLIDITGYRDYFEVQKITNKTFTPDRSYPGANGNFFVSQEEHFTIKDVRKIRTQHLPFKVFLLK